MVRSRKRQGYCDVRPACCAVACRYRSTMGASDSIDECETQAMALRLLSLHAPLEEVRADLGIEAWAIVFKREHRRAVFNTQCDGNLACGGQMLQFVVEEIGNHAVNQRGIG